MRDSTKNSSLPKPAKSRTSESLVSCCENSNRDFGLIEVCAERFEFFDLADLGDVAFSGETVIHNSSHTHTL